MLTSSPRTSQSFLLSCGSYIFEAHRSGACLCTLHTGHDIKTHGTFQKQTSRDAKAFKARVLTYKEGRTNLLGQIPTFTAHDSQESHRVALL